MLLLLDINGMGLIQIPNPCYYLFFYFRCIACFYKTGRKHPSCEKPRRGDMIIQPFNPTMLFLQKPTEKRLPLLRVTDGCNQGTTAEVTVVQKHYQGFLRHWGVINGGALFGTLFGQTKRYVRKSEGDLSLKLYAFNGTSRTPK